jgi:hypothetical protein
VFEKGNKWSTGRPKKSIGRPELLLPAILTNGNVNWCADFVRLYKAMKERELTDIERAHKGFLLELMPYLCTKVQLKELDNRKAQTAAQSVSNAQQTSDLLKALEADNVRPPAA